MEQPEVWKDLSEFGFSKYEASNFGRIRNREKGNIISGSLKDGYPYAFLTNDEGKGKSTQLNRLIAKLFIPNPDELRFVRYKNPPITNINANNLYWSSARDLVIENRSNSKEKVRRPVYQLDDNKKIINRWNSVNEAGEYYECTPHAVRGAINKNKKCKGFHWEYCDIYDINKKDSDIQTKEVKLNGYKSLIVSNNGEIRSKNGRLRYPTVSNSGYKEVCLTSTDKETPNITYRVHRLVAYAFVKKYDRHKDIPFDDLKVNHLDGNKQNNLYTNLEWMTQSENIQHAVDNDLRPKQSRNRPIIGTHKKTGKVKRFTNADEAAEKLDVCRRTIIRACSRDIPTAGGYILDYE